MFYAKGCLLFMQEVHVATMCPTCIEPAVWIVLKCIASKFIVEIQYKE